MNKAEGAEKLLHERNNEEYGIFFLRAAGDGTFVGADPRAFSVIAVPATTAVTRDLDPLIAIAQELAAVLETPPSQLVETRTRHKSATVLQQAQDLYNDAANAIWRIPVSASRAPLEAALKSSPDVLNRCWIIASLIEKGTPVSMDSIKAYLQNPMPGTETTRTAVIQAIGTNRVSPNLTPTLIEFLGSTDVEMRRAAAHALREIENDAAIKALAVTALHDDDAKVRSYAETGLCWATETRTPPCGTPVETNEAQYRAYWTEQAKTNFK